MFLLLVMLVFPFHVAEWIASMVAFFRFLFIIRYKLVDAVMKYKHALHLKVI